MGATQEVEDIVAMAGVARADDALELEKEKENARAAEKQRELDIKDRKEVKIKSSDKYQRAMELKSKVSGA